MQTFTSTNANLHMRIFAYLFGRRKAGGGGGAWQAGRQRAAEGCRASRGRERAIRRLRASRVTAALRDRQRWQACARKGWRADPAEQPTRRSEAKGGGSGVGAAAKALQRGGLPALAVSQCRPCWRAASVLPCPCWLGRRPRMPSAALCLPVGARPWDAPPPPPAFRLPPSSSALAAAGFPPLPFRAVL